VVGAVAQACSFLFPSDPGKIPADWIREKLGLFSQASLRAKFHVLLHVLGYVKLPGSLSYLAAGHRL
jgi:hypothetical protein